MFIKANTLWTQSQIHYEHSPKSNFIKQITSIWNLNVTILRWGQFPVHLYSCNMAQVTSERYCSLPSPVITEGQTTSTSITHTFRVDHQYSTHSLHLKVEHLILPEFVTFQICLYPFYKETFFGSKVNILI